MVGPDRHNIPHMLIRRGLLGALAILAGADTTASALASLFYFLLCNPDCYARVQRELDSVYPGGADPMDTSKHPELIYLTACL